MSQNKISSNIKKHDLIQNESEQVNKDDMFYIEEVKEDLFALKQQGASPSNPAG